MSYECISSCGRYVISYSLWKMLLNEDQRIFETKQVTDNYKILTSCNGINQYKHKWQCFINYYGRLGILQVKID